MRILSLVAMTTLLCTLNTSTRLFGKDVIRESVVKIHSTQRPPDFLRPWTKSSATKSSGTGVVIAGDRVLTNWHVVEYASQLFVQLDQSTDKMAAVVEVGAPGLDMAILRLENEDALKDVPALPIATSLPALRDTVNAYGYPVGGDDLSVTEGIVSRIEFSSYTMTSAGLRIQVDAALNPGNSGGPAVINGEIVGLVFSKMDQAENIGYLIPSEEIIAFLEDAADGEYTGKPTLFDSFQRTENQSLRASLELTEGQGGVMVRDPHESDSNPLKADDVVIRIADESIDNQGNVRIGDDLRLDFRYLIPKFVNDGLVPLTIVRAGQTMEIQVPVAAQREWLIPSLNGAYPRYFIYGPMVFAAATQDFLSALGVKGYVYLATLQSPLMQRRVDVPAFEDEEIVIQAHRMLPHRMIKGYGNSPFGSVQSVNDQPIKNLRHLFTTLRDCQDEFLTFKFHGKHEKIVLRRREMVEVTEDILADEGIRYQYSKDLSDLATDN